MAKTAPRPPRLTMSEIAEQLRDLAADLDGHVALKAFPYSGAPPAADATSEGTRAAVASLKRGRRIDTLR